MSLTGDHDVQAEPVDDPQIEKLKRARDFFVQTNENDPLFGDLAALRRRLDEASVRNNRVLNTARDKLKALSLGIPAWVNMKVGKEERIIQFGYDRLSIDGAEPRWDLWVRLDDEDGYLDDDIDPADAKLIPVLSARREVRAAAVAHLPLILQAIKERAEVAAERNAEEWKRWGV